MLLNSRAHFANAAAIALLVISVPGEAAPPSVTWTGFGTLGHFDSVDAYCRALATTSTPANPYSNFVYDHADEQGNCYWIRDINGIASPAFSSGYAVPRYFCTGPKKARTYIVIDMRKALDKQCADVSDARPAAPGNR